MSSTNNYVFNANMWPQIVIVGSDKIAQSLLVKLDCVYRLCIDQPGMMYHCNSFAKLVLSWPARNFMKYLHED